MYLTMNRFKVKLGQEARFEEVWASRDSQLKTVPGFVSFHMMKGAEDAEGGFRLYASHTLWESEDTFRDWTTSEAFRQAHRNAGGTRDIYVGPPQLECFTSVMSETA